MFQLNISRTHITFFFFDFILFYAKRFAFLSYENLPFGVQTVIAHMAARRKILASLKQGARNMFSSRLSLTPIDHILKNQAESIIITHIHSRPAHPSRLQQQVPD